MGKSGLNLKISSILSGMLVLLALALSLPQEAAAAALSTCSNGGLSGCHFTNNMVKDGTARNTPAGRFLGTHARHSGYSTSSAKREYKYACTVCHGLAGGYTNGSHQTGFKNVSGGTLPKARYSAGAALNGRIPNTNTPTFGNCSNIYCHSTGRGANMGLKQYSSARWAGGGECRACHGGRISAAGAPARSIGNFTLSTTHSQHLKYTNVNCQTCHYKTATDAATLKSYSGVGLRHNNGVRDVTFQGVAYGNYTSYKSNETGSSGTTRTCNNTACHGGKSRGAWSATAQNLDNGCLHCHGAGTGLGVALRADKYNSAPGWGGTGTSTDQLTAANDNRVGAHFKHLSSAYMPKLKCNECHAVPSGPFDGTHMAAMRFTSPTLTFAQASTAVRNTTNPLKTDGGAGFDAICSTTYCHGGKMPKSDTSGTARAPEWAQDTLMTGVAAVDCASCHGNPPTAGSTIGTHSSYVGNQASCVTCHGMMVNAAGVITNKSLHMNGLINATTDCNTCHKYDITGTNAWLNSSGTDLAHYKHIAFIKTRLGYGTLATTGQTFATGESNAVCSTCHTSTLGQHNDGSKQITFGAGGTLYTMGAGTGNSMSLVFGGNPATPTFVTGTTVTCSNLMCHYAVTPNWY